MIQFDKIYCEDLKDDFEEAGRGGKNFTLFQFLQNDLSRAFAFGFCHREWAKEKMWFPVPLRKELRHLTDGMEHFTEQLKWLNSKYDKEEIVVEDYVEFILNNAFCDSREELLKLAVIIGTNLGNESLSKY